MTLLIDSNGFSDWVVLEEAEVKGRAPDAPGAVQLCRRDRKSIDYPKGKTPMVFYFYAQRSVREALLRVFADELETPGTKGQGPLMFRWLLGGEQARAHLEQLFEEFDVRFGAPPVLHQPADDE